MSKIRCYTCLELDRELKPLQDDLKYLISLLCPEIFMKTNHPSMYLVCWECECMVNKMKRFQTRLRKVYEILTLYVKGRSPIQKGLSSLKQSQMETQTIPENLPKPPNVLQRRLNVLELPSSDTLAKRILIDTEIKVEMENEDSFISDFDELIEPTNIQQDDSCMNDFDELIQTTTIQQVLIPNELLIPATNYVLQKPFITIRPKEEVALPGLKKAVKVTVGEPNFTVTAKESPVFVENDRRKIEFRNKVLPATLKGEEIAIRPRPHDSILKTTEEGSQSRGVNDCQLDEAKVIIMNETELEELRRIKRTSTLYLGSRYKCKMCIDFFRTQQRLDEHLLKHDESRGNSICEICKLRFADDLLRDHHYNQHFIKYECLQCPYRHTDRHKIYLHGLKTHQKTTFHCNKCDAVFGTFGERRSHKVHNHIQKKTCPQCGKSFVSSCLKMHIFNVHNGK